MLQRRNARTSSAHSKLLKQLDGFNFIFIQKCGLVLQSGWGKMRTGVVEGTVAESRFPAVVWHCAFFPNTSLAVPLPAI